MAKTALFINFTTEDFTGYWNGKPTTIKAGEKVWLLEYLASHFAKHLTNRELLRRDDEGNLIHKGGDKMTSPKRPEENVMFMGFYSKAFKLEDDVENISIQDNAEATSEVLKKKKPVKKKVVKKTEKESPKFDEMA